jgi:hypothetical protein
MALLFVPLRSYIGERSEASPPGTPEVSYQNPGDDLVSSAAVPLPTFQSRLLRPILVGGGLAGAFDLISAMITMGVGNPRLIAGGLLGKRALQGGAGTWILGFFLHFFIAFSAATIYCLSSRMLEFLNEHWLVSGLFYGIAIYLVMFLIVLPLCAYHFTGPYRYRDLLQGILVHMSIIGLPISFSLHKLAPLSESHRG